MTPRVSVLLPAYRCADYLGEAVQSVLDQTHADFELLLVTDPSPDGTDELIQQLATSDARISVVPNAQTGIAGALNTGLEHARGEFIARMDADDISAPERLSRQVALLDAQPGIILCGSWVRTFGAHDGNEWRLPTDQGEVQATMLFHGSLAHPAVMFRREFFHRHGLAYDPEYKCEDYELWVRAAELGPMTNVPEFLLHYRTHAESLSTVQRARVLEDTSRVRLRQLLRLGVIPTESERSVHDRIGNWEPLESAQEVDLAERWLDHLAVANDRERCFPIDAFRRVLERKREDARGLLRPPAAVATAAVKKPLWRRAVSLAAVLLRRLVGLVHRLRARARAGGTSL